MSEYDPNGYSLEKGLESVGEGWAPLVRKVFANLPTGSAITQVKEKFGALRIYAEPHNDSFQEILNDVETLSLSICEICGNPGVLDTYMFWMRTLCTKHAKERRKY